MQRPDTVARLRHMLDAARRALAASGGRQRADLDSDWMLALALVKLLEIIGEAASTIPAEFRAAHPSIPWKPIIGTRNRLIHAYFDINADIVWSAVIHDLPPLISELERILVIESDDEKG
jgi:uncharacterized protein with HEPN domain